jgi:hypothetical protein
MSILSGQKSGLCFESGGPLRVGTYWLLVFMAFGVGIAGMCYVSYLSTLLGAFGNSLFSRVIEVYGPLLFLAGGLAMVLVEPMTRRRSW